MRKTVSSRPSLQGPVEEAIHVYVFAQCQSKKNYSHMHTVLKPMDTLPCIHVVTLTCSDINSHTHLVDHASKVVDQSRQSGHLLPVY